MESLASTHVSIQQTTDNDLQGLPVQSNTLSCSTEVDGCNVNSPIVVPKTLVRRGIVVLGRQRCIRRGVPSAGVKGAG